MRKKAKAPAKKTGVDDLLLQAGPTKVAALMENGQVPADEADPPQEASIATIYDAMRGSWGILDKVPALAGKIELNLLTSSITAGRRPVDMEDAVLQIRVAADKLYDLDFGKNDTWDAIVSVAKQNAYHPVQTYLEGLPRWDGEVDWIERMATEALHLPESDKLSRFLLRKFCTGAVARALEPGCQFDNVLVLVGPQGYYKSALLKKLACGPDYFGDTPVTLRDKDSYLALHTTWLYEWGELETKRRAASAATVKAFLSATHDLIRPPYGRTTERMARSCVIVGTTNDERFLDDPTGSRRFWPVPISKTIDLGWVEKHRDDIWAQAVARYRAHQKAAEKSAEWEATKWWVPEDDESDEAKLLRARHEQYRVEDAWTAQVLELAEKSEPNGLTSDEILAQLFDDSTTAAYKGHSSYYTRIENILSPKGYLYRRWRKDGKKDSVQRWRHKSWAHASRGNPKLKRGGKKNGVAPSRAASPRAVRPESKF